MYVSDVADNASECLPTIAAQSNLRQALSNCETPRHLQYLFLHVRLCINCHSLGYRQRRA